MPILAAIPARYDSTRFPGKLMQRLGPTTLIAATYAATVKTGLFDEVIVATDSDIIRDEILRIGGTVSMTASHHQSGTDRIAEAVQDRSADVIVNVQGDTPFVNRQALADLIRCFDDPAVEVASLMDRISKEADLHNPNVVKVVTDLRGDALYFSRSPLPYNRDRQTSVVHHRHIGVYAFRKAALLRFTGWPVTPLEDAEKNEALRHLEHGVRIRMVLTQPIGVDVNTPEDLEEANRVLGA